MQLDERGRISFPSQFRACIGEQLYISPDNNYRGFLVVRSEEGYQKQIAFLEAEGAKNGDNSEEIGNCVRDFTMQTAQVTADKNGRLTLTGELKGYSGLEENGKPVKNERAVIVGIGDHAEIWAESRLRAYEEQRRKEGLLKRKRADAAHAAKLIADED